MAYYGYIRVSTKGQVPGTSLAEQEQQIRERYPTATIVREAASGAHERQVFDNLCKSLQAGDTLVVCKMDRFCRSAKEGLQYVDLLRDKGFDLPKDVIQYEQLKTILLQKLKEGKQQ